MSEREQGRIVVGVDGSSPSIDALRWAMRQAEAFGMTVTAVHVWEEPVLYAPPPQVLTRPGAEPPDEAGQWLETAVAKARVDGPPVPVDRHLAEGHPARALLNEAKGADLLVVGNRGHGGFVGTLLGSVSQYCISHSACPVVVVRGPA